jgi:hypothetical protein
MVIKEPRDFVSLWREVEKEDASQATGDLSTRFGDNCTRCKGFVNVVFLAENSEI